MARQIKVVVDGTTMDLAVPSDAEIILNEERVRFRLLQPGDRVIVVYWQRGDVALARALQVTSLP